MTIEVTPEGQKCVKCKKKKPWAEFPLKVRGPGAHHEHTKTCKKCAEDKAQARDKEAHQESDDVSELGLPEFLSFLRQQAQVVSVESRIKITGMEGQGRRPRADYVAEQVWEALDYRFV